MTSDELRDNLDWLGWSARDLSIFSGCDGRLARRWVAGQVPIPDIVPEFIAYACKVHESMEDARRATRKRIHGSDEMLNSPLTD